MKEARKKSLRDFHKTYPSGFGTVVENPPSVEKITPIVTSEGTGDKPRVPDVTNDNSSESESESWGNDEGDSNNEQESSDESNSSNEDSKQENESVEQVSDSEQEEESKDDDQEEEEFVHTPSPTDDKDDDNMESKSDDVNTSNEESDDVIKGDKEIIQEIVSPLDVHVHHEVPRTQAPTLLTIPVSVITESSLSLTARIKEQVKDQLPQIQPKEVSNFDPPVIEVLIKESSDEVTLAKVSSQPHSTYEAASTLTEFELKKILIDKMEKNKDKDEDPFAGSDRGLKKRKLSKDAEPTTGLKNKDSTSGSSKGTKSQPKSFGKSVKLKELVFEINDTEDMLILVVQNRLTNLLRDDVADFAIALRMFTISLFIQKRVEDLQLRVESYQKKINVTKPDTTRLDLRKRHSYTPYKDPKGFIYVDDYKRNRLMRSDELYKFSDGMLTRLLSLLEDITKNIDIEYLSKRRWSTLEKKRAHFMIKDINKLLK
ncbi:hypothetical protein Tco_0465377 [Tanacetum coccineum]